MYKLTISLFLTGGGNHKLFVHPQEDSLEKIKRHPYLLLFCKKFALTEIVC